MTGEVTDRFIEKLYLEWLYFGKKQLNSLQNFFKIHFLTYRVERLSDQEICCLPRCLLVLQISFRLCEIWIVGSQVDIQLN